MNHYSCVVFNRAVQLISKGIMPISELKTDNLLLLAENKIVAEKFIKAKELTNICNINVKSQLHQEHCLRPILK